jgi:dTDP-4-amino-4,6-dideoxygalactose transaminase
MATATPTRKIPFFNYAAAFCEDEADLVRIFLATGRKGAFIRQAELEQFEAHLADYLGARFALGVGNATDGLGLLCRAAGIGPGDEVILSSHTMLATAIGVHEAGGTPVPVDCGPDHLLLPEAVEAALTPRTRAILPTQLNGRVCDMDALGALARRHGLLLLEDAAQALGAEFRGQKAGTFGLGGVFSFYPAKVLGCLGDGGAIVTSDAALYERLCQLSDFGRNRQGEVVGWGLNTRLDNLQAAVLDWRLSRYSDVIARRRALAARYQQRLGHLPQLRLPPAPGSDPAHFDVFQNYEIEAEDRDRLQAHLREAGVGTLQQWGGVAVHQCRALGFQQALPRTDELFQRMLMLPMNTALQDGEVDHIAALITSFYAGR